jgi:hypothetical protein
LLELREQVFDGVASFVKMDIYGGGIPPHPCRKDGMVALPPDHAFEHRPGHGQGCPFPYGGVYPKKEFQDNIFNLTNLFSLLKNKISLPS